MRYISPTKNLLKIAALLLMTFGIQAQEIDTEKLDKYFNALEENDMFMGSMAVLKNNNILYARSVGYAHLEEGIKATPATRYRIGSISKTFTTAMVFKAVETGKLRLDETLKGYFPELKNAKKISIEHLIYHRSGVPNFTAQPDYKSYYTSPKTEEEMLDILKKLGSDFEPDTKAQYSNSNFVLLSYILQKVYKQNYADLLQNLICEPLGLKSTSFDGRINSQNNDAYSYNYVGQWKKEAETNPSIPMGAGGIVSTPTDLVRFSDALFSYKIVSEKSVERMKTLKDNYGMGLFQFPFYEHQGFGHTGGIDAFTSVFTHFADSNVSFALLCNGTRVDNNDVSLAVLSAVYQKTFSIPTFNAFTPNPDDLDTYVGTYSSEQLALVIEVSLNGSTLIAQATGQGPIALDAVEKHQFSAKQYGLTIDFNPDEKQFVLNQGGGTFVYQKKE